MARDEAIQELEERIKRAPEASPFARQVMLHLIRKSEGLTKPVMVATTDQEIGREIAYGRHHCHSSSRTTNLQAFYSDNGLDAYIHSGTLGDEGWGVWVSVSGSDREKAKNLLFDETAIAEIRQISLDPLD